MELECKHNENELLLFMAAPRDKRMQMEYLIAVYKIPDMYSSKMSKSEKTKND